MTLKHYKNLVIVMDHISSQQLCKRQEGKGNAVSGLMDSLHIHIAQQHHGWGFCFPVVALLLHEIFTIIFRG